MLAQFWHLSGQKNYWKWGQTVVSDHYLKKYSHNPIPIQTCGVHLLGDCSDLISFWDTLAKFWPSIGQKIIQIWSKWWFPTIIWKCNSIQTWCVHFLGDCSGLICFRATLTTFLPSSGQKITKNGGFRPLHYKVFMQCNSNLVSALLGLIFRNDSLLATLAKFCPFSCHKMTEKMWFPTIIWKSVHAIHIKLSVYLLGEC